MTRSVVMKAPSRDVFCSHVSGLSTTLVAKNAGQEQSGHGKIMPWSLFVFFQSLLEFAKQRFACDMLSSPQISELTRNRHRDKNIFWQSNGVSVLA